MANNLCVRIINQEELAKAMEVYAEACLKGKTEVDLNKEYHKRLHPDGGEVKVALPNLSRSASIFASYGPLAVATLAHKEVSNIAYQLQQLNITEKTKAEVETAVHEILEVDQVMRAKAVHVKVNHYADKGEYIKQILQIVADESRQRRRREAKLGVERDLIIAGQRVKYDELEAKLDALGVHDDLLVAYFQEFTSLQHVGYAQEFFAKALRDAGIATAKGEVGNRVSEVELKYDVETDSVLVHLRCQYPSLTLMSNPEASNQRSGVDAISEVILRVQREGNIEPVDKARPDFDRVKVSVVSGQLEILNPTFHAHYLRTSIPKIVEKIRISEPLLANDYALINAFIDQNRDNLRSDHLKLSLNDNELTASELFLLVWHDVELAKSVFQDEILLGHLCSIPHARAMIRVLARRYDGNEQIKHVITDFNDARDLVDSKQWDKIAWRLQDQKTHRRYIQAALSLIGTVVPSDQNAEKMVEKQTDKQVKSIAKRNMLVFGLSSNPLTHLALNDASGRILKRIISPTTNQRFVRWFVRTFMRKKMVRDPLHRLSSEQLKTLLLKHPRLMRRALRRGSNAARTFGTKRDVIKHLSAEDLASLLYSVKNDKAAYKEMNRRLKKDKKFLAKLMSAVEKAPDVVLLVCAKYQVHFGNGEHSHHTNIVKAFENSRDSTKALFYEAWLKQKSQLELLMALKDMWAGKLDKMPEVNGVLKPAVCQLIANNPRHYLKLLQRLLEGENFDCVKGILTSKELLPLIVRNIEFRDWLSKSEHRDVVLGVYRCALARLDLTDSDSIGTLSFSYSLLSQSERQAVLENQTECQKLIELIVSNIESLVLLPVFKIDGAGSQMELLLSQATPSQLRTLMHVLRRDKPQLHELIVECERSINEAPATLEALRKNSATLSQKIDEQSAKLPKFTKTKKYRKEKALLNELQVQKSKVDKSISLALQSQEHSRARLKGLQAALRLSSTLRQTMTIVAPLKQKLVTDLSAVEAAALLKAAPKLFPTVFEHANDAIRHLWGGYTEKEVAVFERLHLDDAIADPINKPADYDNIVSDDGRLLERHILAKPTARSLTDLFKRLVHQQEFDRIDLILSNNKIMEVICRSDVNFYEVLVALASQSVPIGVRAQFANALVTSALSNAELHDKILLDNGLRTQLIEACDISLVAYFIATSSIATFALHDWRCLLDRIAALDKGEQQPIMSRYRAMFERKIPQFTHWQFGRLAADNLALVEEGDRNQQLVQQLNSKQYLAKDLVPLLLNEYDGQFALDTEEPLLRNHIADNPKLLSQLLNEVATSQQLWGILRRETRWDAMRNNNKKDSVILNLLTKEPLLSYMIEHATVAELRYLLREFPKVVDRLFHAFLQNPEVRRVMESEARQDESLVKSIFLSLDFRDRLKMLVASKTCFDACIRTDGDYTALLMGLNADHAAQLLLLRRERVTREIITDAERLKILLEDKHILDNDRIRAIAYLVEISKEPGDLLNHEELEAFQQQLLAYITSDPFKLMLTSVSVENLTRLFLACSNDKCGHKVKEYITLPPQRDLLHRILLNCSHQDLYTIFEQNQNIMFNNPFNIFMELLTNQTTENAKASAETLQFKAKQSPSIMRYIAVRADLEQVRGLLASKVFGGALLRVYAEDNTLLNQLFAGVTSQKCFDELSQLFLQLDRQLTQRGLLHQTGDKYHQLRAHMLDKYSETLFTNNFALSMEVAKHINQNFGWRRHKNGMNVYFGDNQNFKYETPEIYFFAKTQLKYPDWLRDMNLNSKIKKTLEDTVQKNAEGIHYFVRYPNAPVPALYLALMNLSDSQQDALDAEYRARSENYEPLVGQDLYHAGSFVRVGA